MGNRTGTAILLAIVAAGIYRIVVFRRLLTRLEAAAGTGPGGQGPGLVRLQPMAGVPGQVRRHPALGRAWRVRGSDGVALDPTIVVPDQA